MDSTSSEAAPNEPVAVNDDEETPMDVIKTDESDIVKMTIDGLDVENEETMIMSVEEVQNYIQTKVAEYMRDPNFNPLLVLRNQVSVLQEKIKQKNEEIMKLNRVFEVLYKDQVKFLRHIGILPKVETKTVGVFVDLAWLPDAVPGLLCEKRPEMFDNAKQELNCNVKQIKDHVEGKAVGLKQVPEQGQEGKLKQTFKQKKEGKPKYVSKQEKVLEKKQVCELEKEEKQTRKKRKKSEEVHQQMKEANQNCNKRRKTKQDFRLIKEIKSVHKREKGNQKQIIDKKIEEKWEHVHKQGKENTLKEKKRCHSIEELAVLSTEARESLRRWQEYKKMQRMGIASKGKSKRRGK